MSIYEDARQLQLNQLSIEELIDIATACKNFRSRIRKRDTKIIIHELVTKDIGEPLHIILNHLLGAAYEKEGVIATEKKLVQLSGVGSATSRQTFTVRQAIEIIISYELIRRVQSLLQGNVDTLMAQWQKTDQEIAALAGDLITPERVQQAKIATVKEWFCDKNLGELSDEQASVIANCQNSLKVVARAGSGKTRTIAQKILFLVHYLGFKRDEIIALVFNRNAREELEQRIKQYENEAKLPSDGAYKVLTFDALAYNLVKPQASLLSDHAQNRLIKEIVLNAIDNEEGLRQQVEELMISSFKSDWEKTLRLNTVSTEVDLARLRSFLTEQSIDGKEVKSKPEKRIADFLFEHDIPYLYEMPFAVDDGHVIRPDFYIPTHGIVLEYYGLRGNQDYERAISYKRQYWVRQKNITLIEINPDFFGEGSGYDACCEADYQKLTDLLSERTAHLTNSIQPQRLSDQELLAKLRDRIQLDFCNLVQNALVRAGQMMCSDTSLIEQIANFTASSPEERGFLDILPAFLAMYRDRLANSNFIDFSQVKKTAIDLIASGKTVLDWDQGRNGIDLKKLRFVFVDEFQDFSDLFRGLLLAILQAAPGALVNAVGDDWQMINRFAGSKPELFDQFEEDYPLPITVYLQTNYRSAGGIVEFCNAIMRTNGIKGRPAIACDAMRNVPCTIARLDRDQLAITPRESHYFKDDTLLASVFRLYKPLTEQFAVAQRKDGEQICFAISRSNNPPLQVDANRLGVRARSNREIINSAVNKLAPEEVSRFFGAITGHKSKGLEAYAVVVLQPKQFPMIHQRSIFLQFFGDTPSNLLRDELNLFYVTCSRAKQSLYFLPESGYMMSPFLGLISKHIDVQAWNRFPCRLNGPQSLHKLYVQSNDEGSGALYQAQKILRSHGLESFSRPKKIPTRSLLVRQDYLGTLVFLQRVVQACSEFDLKYIILDGLNQEIVSFPGPKSIEEVIDEEQGEP